MMKRSATPLSKDRLPTKNTSNQHKVFKDIRNIQPKQLSRNGSTSKLISNEPPLRYNPQSADRRRKNKVITDQMRKILVEWMLEVSHRSKMRRQTIFIAIKLLDYGLQGLKDIGCNNAQLLAATCLFMSAKYEQIYPESLNKFLDYTLNSYLKTQMLMMQQKILSLMAFKLTFQTRYTYSFIIYQKQLSFGSHAKKLKSFITFLLQLSLLTVWDQVSDQQIAQAAVFLAAKVLKYPPPSVSQKVMENAYRLMGIWRQNEGGIIAFLYDNDQQCYVGGLKIIY